MSYQYLKMKEQFSDEHLILNVLFKLTLKTKNVELGFMILFGFMVQELTHLRHH